MPLPTHPSRRTRRSEHGLTVLEIMVVLAIVAGLSYLGYGALRWVRKEGLIQGAVEIGSVFRRTSQLAAETGTLHRVVFDLDAQVYRAEVCEGGPGSISRVPEPPEQSDESRQRAVANAKQKLSSVPQNALPTSADAEQAETMALALAGQLSSTRTCKLAMASSGDAEGRELQRRLDTGRGVRVKQIWVQHLEDPATSGLVAIYFFPLGSAEKAIVEVGDSDGNNFSVLLSGLTSRVEVRDGSVQDPDDFLMRDAEGEKLDER